LISYSTLHRGFDDPENGIRGYRWGLGSAPGRAEAFAMAAYSGQVGGPSAVHTGYYASNYTAAGRCRLNR
jgi:hypothetical protein